MRKLIALLFCLSAVFIYFNYQGKMSQENLSIKAPVAEKRAYEYEIHGRKIQDEYAWLRAKEWPEKVTDNNVISYLEQENEYFKNYMSPLQGLKDELFAELKGRIKLSDQSTYVKENNYYYYTRTEEDKEYAISCRKYGSVDAPEEIILDENELAKGHNFMRVASISVNPEQRLMAYSVDFTGGEKYSIYFYDLKEKKFLDDKLENCSGRIIWHEDGSGIFYSPTTENWRTNTVKFHKLGSKNEDDKVILHEADPLYSVIIRKSSSKKYIFIDVGGHDSDEIYYIDLADEQLSPELLVKRQDKIRVSVDHRGQHFYQHTNDGAENFHIIRATAKDYEPDDIWEVYIAENDKYLSSFDLTNNFLILNYRNNGLPEIVVQHIDSKEQKDLKFPDAAYVAGGYSTNFLEDDIRVSYSSLARPSTTYSYDFQNGQLSILKTQEIPSGFNPDEYQVERLWAKSQDGTMVPMSVMYKKSLFKHDGSNPAYLYGYGSYGHSVGPSFRSTAVSLANRGFVFAIAHLRGGSDLGQKWYEDAKFLTKKRTFEDFIACAEHLIEHKYSAKGQIAIAGDSAGGMLVGSVINQRPELFKLVITHVPFVDVVNTMLDGDLPLTPGEYKEWGNPKEKEYFEYMMSYSPYDNIKAQNYPHILATAGLSDPRVGYWEVAKWVARLRANKTDNNSIIFKTNMEFGHAGASGRFDYLKDVAEDIAFMLKIFGKMK